MFFVTARAQPSTESPLILIDGFKAVEEIRVARPSEVPDREVQASLPKGRAPTKEEDRERPFMVVATRTEGGSVQRRPIDISWLPGAAEVYHISANPKDHVFVDIPFITADVPNRNMDNFPMRELTAFSPIYGRYGYRTFIGKPTHVSHINKDPTKAKGVHYDATLRQVTIRPGHVGYNSGREPISLWKVRTLSAFCRQKDEKLVKGILKRQVTGYSMGAMIGYATCSLPWCKAVTTGGKSKCQHIRQGKGRVVRGHLVYDNVHDINFIEGSALPSQEPADSDCYSPDGVLTPQKKRVASVSEGGLWVYGTEAA